MKSTPSALKTHMAGGGTSVALYWKITRSDGVTLGFTNHDRTQTIGGQEYEAHGGFSASAIVSSSDTSIDNLDAAGAWNSTVTSNRITAEDLRAGLYDNAEVWVFRYNWGNIAQGVENPFYGRMGSVKIGRSGFSAQVQDLSSLLHQQIGSVTSAVCQATLGDTDCKIVLNPAAWLAATDYSGPPNDYEPGDSVSAGAGKRAVAEVGGISAGTEPIWPAVGNTIVDGAITWRVYEAWTKSGTVTSVTNRSKFYDSSRGEADNWFQFGKITWLTGDNAGLSMEIKRNLNSGGFVELILPMAYAIQIGDTYEMHAGCNHLRDTVAQGDFLGHCKTKFDNVINFFGQPDCTGTAKLIDGGGSGA